MGYDIPYNLNKEKKRDVIKLCLTKRKLGFSFMWKIDLTNITLYRPPDEINEKVIPAVVYI